MDALQLVEQIDKLILESLQQNASDIHFEPYQNHYRIRLRIDGVLQEKCRFSIEYAKQISARLKIMAKLNIAEQRLPQDGQLIIEQYALRMSTLPVIQGEKIVLRLIDNQKHKLSLSALGLSKTHLALIKKILQLPQGLILVTGPTGSGKTVTLYSSLKQLNVIHRNICCVEDPIETSLEGINQTAINSKAGLSFPTILRSLLRQDPDVIMIGEIRDIETAEIAIQAAQTGHLVLSTLHTNSSIEAINRLNQMGIKSYLLASSLKLIIAQRLVRKLCEHCKILAPELIKLGDIKSPHFIAAGCKFCNEGYQGRTGLYELLMITPEIEKQLLTHQLIKPHNFHSLKSSAHTLISQGITTVNEIIRVLGDIE